MKTSLKEILFKELQNKKRLSRNSLREIAESFKYDVSTCDRKLRELTEEGLIKKREENGFIVEYYVEVITPNNINELNYFISQKLKCLKPNWENYETIKKLQEALKSKFLETKKNVLI